MRTLFLRGLFAVGTSLAVLGTPAAVRAQKALVYCPVAVDATGCAAVVAALTGPTFPLGVDRGHDGTSGTVDLETVDLFTYSVVVVPSLADAGASSPYARLRDVEVVEHLKAALIGRIALWSGSPDQGASNRAMKDALIQNLAAWAGGAFATARGPGLVAFLDGSSSPMARYDWLRAITPLPVTADANLLLYDAARALNPRGTTILTSGAGPIAYANMATYGFQVPNGAPGISLDAVGQTGSSQGGQVILLTAEAGNTSPAVVRTDKDDYAPGQVVTITGSGWQPGELVKLTLHMDPLRDTDTELAATADANGSFTNADFAPAQYDIGVRFVLTAVGQESGRRAQTTFTDAVGLQGVSATPTPQTVTPGTSAIFSVVLNFNGGGSTGCVATLSVSNLPPGTSASWTPAPGASAPSNGADVARTLTITTTVAAPATTITIQAVAPDVPTVPPGQGCNGATVSTTVSLTIAGGNVAPTLTGVPASPQSIPELQPYTFDANATDPGAPPQTLTFSLLGAPAAASIHPVTGVFTWTPAEAQGPGSFPFTVRVSDGTANADQALTLNVTEVNAAPVLDPIGPKTVNEGSPLTFTATATDADIPANTLTFSLVGAPAGASIDPASGAFTWTPTETQGPGSFTFTVKVADNGAPSSSDEEAITVTVNEVNVLPTLTNVPVTATIPELAPYTFDANATDPDDPPQTLTFSLESAPAGAAIDPSSGVFSWTPAEGQGPAGHTFKVKVFDGVGSTEQSVTLTVTEVNSAPVLAPIGNRVVDEQATLSFTAAATDTDLPPNVLTYSLDGAPSGAAINASSGAFTWIPTEAQGPGSFTFVVRVADSGTPTLSDEETITVTVNEVNVAPILAAIANQTVNEEANLTFNATATDADQPANGLTFSLVAGTDPVPPGATIHPSTGAFSWTPTEAQGAGVYKFNVRVTDDGSPLLFDEQEITVTVNEVNLPPVLAAIGDKTVNEEAALTFTATATDPDVPPNMLTFTLVGAPAGATISSAGAFSWTPNEGQGPGTFTFTVKVTDDGSPALSDEEAITVTVNEVNVAPVLSPIGNKVVDEETLLSFTATATDADLPPNSLSFSLLGTVPAGAAIDAVTGAFTWTPAENQGPASNTFRVRVTDNGNPILFDEEEITVTVNEVNKPPVLGAVGNKVVNEETALTFTAAATDPDLPPNALAFSLAGAPAGATIDPTTGAFSWTPAEADGPGSFTFIVKVTDNGTPALSDEEQITVTVNEVNKAPTVGTIPAKIVNEGVALTFTATATDPDLPPNTLTFSLVSPPAGAVIDPATGAFSWTPPDGPTSPTPVMITVRVADNGTPALSDDEVFAVTVNNVPPTATFNVPAGPFAEGQTFAISLTSPVDVPADVPTLKYQFDCGTGPGYGAATATSTATCPAQDNPAQDVKGRIVDKDGGATEYTGSVPVTNVAPVVGAITITPSDVVPINTTITATAPFTDAGTKDTHTGTYDWGDGSPTSPATIAETNGSGTATATHTYTATGVYVVTLTVRDKDTGQATATYQYVVVYDPAGGFVTGGGWIDSPAGAYVANPGLVGKANFGFVSKYKKGQSTPDGNTEFQFHAASLNFKATLYDWLVIAGSKAQYKGTGTINGSGEYGFILTAVDGNVKGTGFDTFRMKIWVKATNVVVYDNLLNASDTAEPITRLGGGSIQIHDK